MTDGGLSRGEGKPGFRHGDHFGFEGGDSTELVNYAAILRKLWRRKFLLAAIAALVFGAASALIVRMPAHYVAHAFVALGDPLASNHPSRGANQASTPTPLPDAGTIQTEIEILKSPQLAIEVIRDLKLQNNPEFNPSLSPDERLAVLSWAIEWLFGERSPSGPHADAAAELSQTITNFLGRLRVSTKEPSRMIDIAFDSTNPVLAMQIANAMADRYIGNQLELRLQSAQRTSAWLRDKIGKLQAKVESSEKTVEAFRSEAGLFSGPGGTPLLLKQMTDVSAELAKAQTARAAAEAHLRQLGAPGQPKDRIIPTKDIVDSPFMRTLDTQEAEAQQKLAEASASLGAKNPTTVGLRERLRHIQAARQSERLRVAASLENDAQIARMKERDLSDRLVRLQGEVADMNRAEIKLRALEREAEADRLVLNNFMGRFKETSQEGDSYSQKPNVQIVSYAQLPVHPERPKRGLLILIAGVASLIGGALIALLVENTDRSLHGLEEVEGALNVTGLGMLPVSKGAQLSPSEAARYGSSYREAAKATYSRLFCIRMAPQVTMVTSAFPGEGKTVLALSLAAMAAQGGQRVVLVDADFWKGGAGVTLGIRSGAGLAEVLEGKAKLADVVVSDIASGADVVLPGMFSRASLLAWIGKLPELLESLRKQYDVVIVDGPPVLSVPESTLLASHADATVMAIRWASTPRDAIKVALKKLNDAGASVAGAALTMVRERQHARYGYPETAYLSNRPGSYRPVSRTVTRSSGSPSSGKGAALPRRDGHSTSAHSGQDASPRHALLVLDIEKVLADSSGLPSQACDRLTERINDLSQVASRSGFLVLYADQERQDVIAKSLSWLWTARSNRNHAFRARTNRRPKAVPGSSFTKRGRDAFSNGKLASFLRKEGVAHLFLAGLEGATSIRRTARSALDRGYRVTFVQDAIFTADERKWERALRDFEAAAAFAITSEEFAEFAMAVHRTSEAARRPPWIGQPTGKAGYTPAKPLD